MKDVLVRGMPEELHAWLKAEADRNGRSVNAEIIEMLEDARRMQTRAAERLARMEALRSEYLPEGGMDLDEIIATIRAHRDGG